MVLSNNRVRMVVTEDDDDDYFFIKEALSDAVDSDLELLRHKDGEELMSYLLERDAKEKIDRTFLLLDLNLPKKDGRQALREIKNHPALRKIPVVILTTSAAHEDIDLSYALGANAYAVKPPRLSDFQDLIRVLARHWGEKVALPTTV